MSGYTFEQMYEQVSFLRVVLGRAITADRDEATSFWTAVKRAGEHGLLGYGAEKERFEAEGANLVNQANTAMMRIDAKCTGILRRNAPIPQQLEADARRWDKHATDVQEMILLCTDNGRVPGWSGPSKNGYVQTVVVQENALRELKGVMESTAQSCRAGAALNKAIFEAVGKATYKVRARVDDSPGASGSAYYVRTANAIPHLEALAEQVDRAASGEVADGSASILSGEANNTVSALPNLLVEGQWPTGADAAGVAAADTASGVASDGSDANTNVEANVRSCVARARL